ncbi:ankyrin repeat domain-containing protein [Aspergillus lucknowensis]|uniref:Ankyrin repeat-containing domain protein n=1 Tax=Aspergillus lucknowensis TaxID=176173 RepID=A0ABR4LQX4_9EURO
MSLPLDCGVDVNMYDGVRDTPLHMAVNANWPWAVQTLLSRGAIVNAGDARGSTALYAAIEHGKPRDRLRIVRLLLEYGGDPKCNNNYRVTPLSLAMTHDHLDIVQLIVAREFTLDTVGNMDRLICIAAQGGDKALIKEAVRLGADINKSGRVWIHEWPPLLHANYGGQLEAMKFLISIGAILDPLPGSDQPTPLHLALAQGHLAAAQWLLSKGADLRRTWGRLHRWKNIHSTSRPTWKSLHFAAIGGLEVFRLVLDQGYVLPLGDPTLDSVWACAVCGRDSTNQEFLQLVPHSIRDESGDYADAVDPVTYLFELPMRWLKEGMVKAVLKESGVSLCRANEQGEALLHISAIGGNEDIIKPLLSLGAPVNAKDSRGRTALFNAASTGSSKIVRMILEWAASPHSDTPKNHPLWACLFGPNSIFRIIPAAITEDYIAPMCARVKELLEHATGTSEILQQRTILRELLLEKKKLAGHGNSRENFAQLRNRPKWNL